MVQMQVRSQTAQVGVSTTTSNAAPTQLSLTVCFYHTTTTMLLFYIGYLFLFCTYRGAKWKKPKICLEMQIK